MLEKVKAQAEAPEKGKSHMVGCPLNLYRLFSRCDYEKKLKLYFPSS